MNSDPTDESPIKIIEVSAEEAHLIATRFVHDHRGLAATGNEIP